MDSPDTHSPREHDPLAFANAVHDLWLAWWHASARVWFECPRSMHDEGPLQLHVPEPIELDNERDLFA